MRLVFCKIFLLFFSLTTLFAQKHSCGSTFDQANLLHFKEIKDKTPNITNRSDEMTYIPVRFHLVATTEGEGRLRFENALDQLCELNTSFADLNIKFYLKGGDVNEVNNNTIYNNPASAAGATKMAGEKSEFGQNAVNIFFTDNAQTDSDGITLGYYSFNQDLVVLKKSTAQNNSQSKFVIGHEVGHFFSLPHTFNGWENEPWDGTPVTSTTSPGGELNELADMSNCDVAGDMICDTPADYNLGFGWDGCRDYDGGCTDPDGALLNPDESNFMGYFIGCNEYHFSDQQKIIIKNDYESSRRSYLRVSYQPTDQPIQGLPVAIAPLDGSTTDFYNGVELSWTAIENATNYLVELTQGLSTTYYKVTNNKLFLTDLKQERSYRWKVRPYSEINTCSSYSETFQFVTGDKITSTHDLETFSKNIRIYPNPIVENRLYIEMRGDNKVPYQLELIDLNGKVIRNESVRNENYVLDNLNLLPGFYLVKISQGSNSTFKKIIINE